MMLGLMLLAAGLILLSTAARAAPDGSTPGEDCRTTDELTHPGTIRLKSIRIKDGEKSDGLMSVSLTVWQQPEISLAF